MFYVYRAGMGEFHKYGVLKFSPSTCYIFSTISGIILVDEQVFRFDIFISTAYKWSAHFVIICWHVHFIQGNLFVFQKKKKQNKLCVLKYFQVHVAGVWKSLPLLKHISHTNIYSFSDENSPFLLNSQVTFALYILSTLLVLSSSIVLYFYGHTRYIPQQKISTIFLFYIYTFTFSII